MIKRGFTLIEILITLAIIATLAAIVLSMVITARASAQRTTCMSNLTQLHKSLTLYQADHNGNDPPYNFLDLPGKPSAIADFGRALSSYGLVATQLFCPLDKHQGKRVLSEWSIREFSSYVTGAEMIPFIIKHNNVYGVFRPDLVSNPADFIYYLDQTDLVPEPPTRKRVSSHGEMMNCLYLDGHVKHIPVFKP